MVRSSQTVEREVGPIEMAAFNIGANVRFPMRETTSRVYFKVWEMACFAGFLMGREVAKAMVPRGRGSDPVHRRDRERARWRGIAPSPAPRRVCARWRKAMARELGPRASMSPT